MAGPAASLRRVRPQRASERPFELADFEEEQAEKEEDNSETEPANMRPLRSLEVPTQEELEAHEAARAAAEEGAGR